MQVIGVPVLQAKANAETVALHFASEILLNSFTSSLVLLGP